MNQLCPSDVVLIAELASAIFDPKSRRAIILDERNGFYWELSSNMYDLFAFIWNSPNGKTVSELNNHFNSRTNQEKLSVNELIVHLIQAHILCVEHHTAHYYANSINKTHKSSKRKASLFRLIISRSLHDSVYLERDTKKQATFCIVFFYSILNAFYRIQIALGHWSPVAKIRLNQHTYVKKSQNVNMSNGSSISGIVNIVIAASRLACIFPWVTPKCTVAALAHFHLLKKMGFRPKLVIAAKVIPFEPHMWVELEGQRVDLGSDLQSLDEFRFSPDISPPASGDDGVEGVRTFGDAGVQSRASRSSSPTNRRSRGSSGCSRLCSARADGLWARFVVHQDLQTVLRCHPALADLGGVPEEIL